MREVYVLAGQSNMIGLGREIAPTYQNADRIFRFSQPWDARPNWRIPVAYPPGTGTWGPAADPLHSDPQCGVGPGMAFADKLIELRGDLEIGLVPCAWGGSGIRELWADQFLWWSAFGMLLARMHEAAKWGPIKGLIWYQGEFDARSRDEQGKALPVPSYYQAEMFRLAKSVWLCFGRIPIIVTKLGPCPNYQTYGWWNQIQSYIETMAGVDPMLSVVDASDLTLIGDGSPHITAGSAVTLGHRHAQAMHEMQS